MDPNACLERYYRAIFDGEKDEANDAYSDLLAWLSRGGFEPDWAKIAKQFEMPEYFTRDSFLRRGQVRALLLTSYQLGELANILDSYAAQKERKGVEERDKGNDISAQMAFNAGAFAREMAERAISARQKG